MKRCFRHIASCFAAMACCLATEAAAGVAAADSLQRADVATMLSDGEPQWKELHWMRSRNAEESNLERIQRKLNPIDTNYIEPQRFNFTVMVQNINTYEVYRMSTNDGRQRITFSPDMGIKIGPYFGWRWAFLGYTIDIHHMDLTHRDRTKTEYDVSLYSSMLGLDLFYRKTGNDYKIRELELGDDINTEAIEGVPFGGLTSSIKGFNIYYIFNHRKFSYPAAFSQSTVQRRSAGSPLLGVGYTRHKLSVDWEQLDQIMEERLQQEAVAAIDSSLLFGMVKYTDVSFSGGYAYNWVFARNWLLATSLSLALAYKRTTGDSKHDYFTFRDFTLNNLNIDGIGRFGLVWNNTRWYAGASAILHAYNYRKSQFSTNNFFGSVNLYVGFNFGRRRQ